MHGNLEGDRSKNKEEQPGSIVEAVLQGLELGWCRSPDISRWFISFRRCCSQSKPCIREEPICWSLRMSMRTQVIMLMSKLTSWPRSPLLLWFHRVDVMRVCILYITKLYM